MPAKKLHIMPLYFISKETKCSRVVRNVGETHSQNSMTGEVAFSGRPVPEVRFWQSNNTQVSTRQTEHQHTITLMLWLGGSILIFGEKKNPVVNGIFCQDKMLEYAYNWQLRIENTNVSKTVKILSEYNRTDVAGESLRKIQSGSDSSFESAAFLCVPIEQWMGYQPDYSFSAFRRSFTHLCWRIPVSGYIAQVVTWCSQRDSRVKYRGSNYSNRSYWKTNCPDGYIIE